MSAGRLVDVEVIDKSLRDFVFACKFAGDQAADEMEVALGRAGGIVQRGAAFRTLAHGDGKTAAGFRTFVESTEVTVAQVFPKTSGDHGVWGAWQMRHALIPAIYDNVRPIVAEFESATDRVCDRFNG